MRIFSLLLFIIFVSAGYLFAQSTKLEFPTPINSNELKKSIQGDGREYYYSFWAKPGEVTLQISVTTKRDNTGVEIYFLNKDGDEISDNVMVQYPDSSLKKRIDLAERERITLKIKEMQYGSNSSYPGNLSIKFSGSFFVPDKNEESSAQVPPPNEGSFSLEKPTLITSFNYSKRVLGDNRERYFAFVAKPGRVTVTFNLKATMDNAGVEIYFLDKQGNNISDFTMIQSVGNSNVKESRTIAVKKLSTLVLKVKEMAYGSRPSYPGNLTIDFSGSFVALK